MIAPQPFLSFPAAISLIVSVVGGLFALLTARASAGPGWRELRLYSVCAALGSLFAVCDIAIGLPEAPPHVVVVAARLTLFLAGLHGGAWFAYSAAQERRPLSAVDRAVILVGLVVGLTALIPGALVSDRLFERRWERLGWIYRDALPTPLGCASYVVYCAAMGLLTYRYARGWRRGEPYAKGHFLGLGALLVAAVNDSLVVSRVYDAPYLIDVGFLMAIVFVGSAMAERFVASAHSLDARTDQLRTTQAILVQRERLASLGEVSAVVAHEVRNPIAIIFNAVALLRRAPPPSSDAAALLKVIDDETLRLMRLVNDLLAYARPGTLRLTRAPLDVLLTDAAEAAHASAPAGSASVHVTVATELPAVECDPQLVRQAVINLVTNALEAAPREAVQVRAELEPGNPKAVRIVVADRGTGIPTEAVPKLFMPFFTTRPTGTGLGLAIVRKVAEAHGGEVGLSTSQGAGATFWLRLPVDAPTPSGSFTVTGAPS